MTWIFLSIQLVSNFVVAGMGGGLVSGPSPLFGWLKWFPASLLIGGKKSRNTSFQNAVRGRGLAYKKLSSDWSAELRSFL
jgi:hypothetical protein